MVLPRSGPMPFGLQLKYLDVLLPFPTAFFVLMFLLERGEPCRLEVQKGALAVNALAVLAVVFWQPSSWAVALTVLSSFCLWVSPGYYLRNPYRASILPCVLVGFSVAIYLSVPNSVYGVVGNLTSQVTGKTVAALFGNRMHGTTSPTGQFSVSSGAFSAVVGQKCWGLDGFFYFTVLFLLFSALYRKALRMGRWFSGYFLGLGLMFALNILRVLLILNVGSWAYETLGVHQGSELLKSIVHPHLGWLLYTPALILYFPLCLRLVRSEAAPGFFSSLRLPFPAPTPTK